MAPLDIFPVSWDAADTDAGYAITLHGKTPAGELAAARITFYPYFFVRVPPAWGVGQVRLFIAEAAGKHRAVPSHCRATTRTSMWGFTDGEAVPLVQLAFNTHKDMKFAARALGRTHQTFESGVDPLLRFFHLRDIQPAQWVRVGSRAEVLEPTTAADIEVTCAFGSVSQSPVREVPPLVIASWDLECYSALAGKPPRRSFPRADNEDDAIIQIACSYLRYGEAEPYRRAVFCFKDTAPVPGVEVRSFDEEHEMINAWVESLHDERVDVLLGYNTNQFDAAYLYGRSLVLVDNASGESAVDLSRLGRLLEGGGAFREWELNSGAFGSNKFATLATPGVLQVDLLQIFRRELKLDSYTLAAVSTKYLGDTKIDLPAKEIFELWERTPADRARIAEYAAKDTDLPLRLLAKMCTFENLREMANACFVTMDMVLNRGQQIKVFSVLMKKARQMGFACPDGVGIGVVGKYTGATVLEAHAGAYMDVVSGLDFSSRARRRAGPGRGVLVGVARSHRLRACPAPRSVPEHHSQPQSVLLDDRARRPLRRAAGRRVLRHRDRPGALQVRAGRQGAAARAAGRPRRVPQGRQAQDGRGQGARRRVRGLAAQCRAARIQGDHEQRVRLLRRDQGHAQLRAHRGQRDRHRAHDDREDQGARGVARARQPRGVRRHGASAPGGGKRGGAQATLTRTAPAQDSVMVILNLGPERRHDLAAHIDKAQWLADEITKAFPRPVELEWEKVYYPYLLFSKKRYAGLMYTKPDKADYIDVKGLSLVRRDSCPLVKTVSNAMLAAVMHDKSFDKAADAARACILRVLRNEEPFESFVVSKALRKDYKSPAQPHLTVAKKIFRRTGEPVAVGSRVPFVFVEDPANADALLHERAEDPAYAREQGLVIDRLHYIRHQLQSPISQVLQLIVDDPERELFDENIAPLVQELEEQQAEWAREAKRVKTNVARGQREITAFFQPAQKPNV